MFAFALYDDTVGWSEHDAAMDGGVKLQIVNLLKAFRVLRGGLQSRFAHMLAVEALKPLGNAVTDNCSFVWLSIIRSSDYHR